MVDLAAREPRVRLLGDAVDALRLGVGVLLLHVDLERLLVLVVPVTLGALECLARVARVHHHVTAERCLRRRAPYDVTLVAVFAGDVAVGMVLAAGADDDALHGAAAAAPARWRLLLRHQRYERRRSTGE